MGFIYLLVFSNGKFYVGQTRRSLAVRWAQHKNVAASRGKSILYHAWRKHGEPVLVTLGKFPASELDNKERELIATLGTMKPHGYNTTPGGDAIASLDPEVARKIGDSHRGRKRTPEQCAAMSARLKGKIAWNKGRSLPSQTAAARAFNKGRKLSAEHKAKLSSATIGRPNPRMKGKKLRLGAKWSDEQRANLSAVKTAEAEARKLAGLVVGRARTSQCKNGHPWRPETTYVKPNGERRCRICPKRR